DHSGSFTLTNEEYVDNMTKGWVVNPSPASLRYAMVSVEGVIDSRDSVTVYKAHCDGDSVTDLTQYENQRKSGVLEYTYTWRGSDIYNCAYVEFFTDASESDFEGFTLDFCVNFGCTQMFLVYWLDLILMSWVASVIICCIMTCVVRDHRRGKRESASGILRESEYHNPRHSGRRVPPNTKEMLQHHQNPTCVVDGVPAETKAPVLEEEGLSSVYTRTEPELNESIVLGLYMVGLHRWYLGKPYPILFPLTLGGLGFWWAADFDLLVFEWITPANFTTSGWSKRMQQVRANTEEPKGPIETPGAHIGSGPLASAPVPDLGSAAIAFSSKGMGHSGQGRPVFVYTGPLGEDGSSPAETLGEGEAYTALLIG
ncbi:hypothetical protein KIPB_012050, partial [Kipferlia bialata]